jgi:hypothetical protein
LQSAHGTAFALHDCRAAKAAKYWPLAGVIEGRIGDETILPRRLAEQFGDEDELTQNVHSVRGARSVKERG